MSSNGLPALTAAVPGEIPAEGVGPGGDTPEQLALAAMIRAAQGGDQNAIQSFLQVIAPAVRRTCRSVLGFAHADLEDTIQESMLASLKALPKYRFDSDVRRYVTTISLRAAITARKRNAARWQSHLSIDATEEKARQPTATSDTLMDGMALVRRILDELPGTQSEVMFMRVVLGFTVAEIATITHVSQNTVKTRLTRGKVALRTTENRPGVWRRIFSR